MKIIIKNGMIVSPSEEYIADILIEDEKIVSIGTNILSDNCKVIDATNKYVLPGAIDVHTHLDLDVGIARAVDDFYTGTVAAACGGTTTIVDHIAFGPNKCRLRHQIEEYHKLADEVSVIDYGFHGVIQHTKNNCLDEIEELIDEGISSFKVYLTYDFKLNDAEVLEVLLKMKELGCMTAFHAENHHIINHLRKKYVEEGKTDPIYHAKSRPDYCESEAISRLINISSIAGDAPIYIVHLSSEKGLEVIKKAREDGHRNIFVETCPQYLLLTEDKYLQDNNEGLKYIMSPPLRLQQDCDALWRGLSKGDIDVIATDHCPFNFRKEKQMGKDDFTKCPNGAPGVEERVRVIFSEGVMKNKISINKFVETMCTNPAKIYGLYPKKGILQPGSDADIVIINPNDKEILTKSEMKSAVDYTAYEGMEIECKIDIVMQRGNIIVENNKFLGKKGDGNFLKRKINKLS